MQPLIGITSDLSDRMFTAGCAYVDMIRRAGGIALILPCVRDFVTRYVELCDGFVLTGGDDPIPPIPPHPPHWNVPLHPKAKSIDPRRQEFELALLDAVADKPVLGVCLGMQLMGLHAGGKLDQHLPDSLPTADLHWQQAASAGGVDGVAGREHEVRGEFGAGNVHSHHRQALTDSGSLRVIATAPDGVIEAICADDRPFYLGVQWHPERTKDQRFGSDLFAQLIAAASSGPALHRSRATSPPSSESRGT